MPGAFVCHACQAVTPEWQAWCRSCEYVGGVGFDPNAVPNATQEEMNEDDPIEAGNVIPTEKKSISTGLAGFDDVTAGGYHKEITGDSLLRGSSVLVTGIRGGGKTRLVLATFSTPAKSRMRCLYVSAEETKERVSMYVAQSNLSPKIQLCQTQDLERALELAELKKIDLLAIDSAQKFRVGGMKRLVHLSEAVRDFTKTHPTVIVVLSQENKTGDAAGANDLPHDLDVILRVTREADGVRVLKCDAKNRYGHDDHEWRFRIVETPKGTHYETVKEQPAIPVIPVMPPPAAPFATLSTPKPPMPRPPPIPKPVSRPVSRHPGLHIVPRKPP
jgi:DNA repair protein RadA/Sms